MKIFSYTKQLAHIVFWLFMWLFIFDYYYEEAKLAPAIGYTTLEILTYATLVYFNLLFLIPLFLKRGFTVFYILAVSLSITGYILILHYSGLEKLFYDHLGWRNVFSMLLNASLFMLVSLLFWYFKQWQLEKEKQLILQNEKLAAELNFLRTQMNPHFIFNTLNNIYSLSLQKHENAAPMIANLSAILRYTLYEGTDGHVSLQHELKAVQQLIDIYLMAKPKSSNVVFNIEGDPGAWQIVPMLLLHFTENCFKHSNMNTDSKAFIKINCAISAQGQFIFSTLNSYLPVKPAGTDGGIGLQNARRQLELFYPQAHILEMKADSNIYYTTLTLMLSKLCKNIPA